MNMNMNMNINKDIDSDVDMDMDMQHEHEHGHEHENGHGQQHEHQQGHVHENGILKSAHFEILHNLHQRRGVPISISSRILYRIFPEFCDTRRISRNSAYRIPRYGEIKR
jgi:hypothetical protein